jgi:hypothetical protein
MQVEQSNVFDASALSKLNKIPVDILLLALEGLRGQVGW